MKSASVRQPGGYTIVETMIFLLVSSVLLVAAVSMFGGRIGRTQFTQSVQELATKITSTNTESASGTYPNYPGFSCSNVAGLPTISPLGSDTQGTRDDCVFVGKVMNFSPAGAPGCTSPIVSGKCEDVDIYTVVGRRELTAANNTPVTSLFGVNGANPTIVHTPAVNITNRFHLTYGTRVTAAYLRLSNGTLRAINSVGFFQFGNGGTLSSGAQTPSIWAVNPSSSTLPPSSPADNDAVLKIGPPTRVVNVDTGSGVLICVKSGNNNQTASIGIGVNNTSFVSQVTIGDTRCPS